MDSQTSDGPCAKPDGSDHAVGLFIAKKGSLQGGLPESAVGIVEILGTRAEKLVRIAVVERHRIGGKALRNLHRKLLRLRTRRLNQENGPAQRVQFLHLPLPVRGFQSAFLGLR